MILPDMLQRLYSNSNKTRNENPEKNAECLTIQAVKDPELRKNEHCRNNAE